MQLSPEPRLGKGEVWGSSFGAWQSVYLFMFLHLYVIGGPFFRRETENDRIQGATCLGIFHIRKS